LLEEAIINLALLRTVGITRSVVPLLLAVVAGQGEEQRATHANRSHQREQLGPRSAQPAFAALRSAPALAQRTGGNPLPAFGFLCAAGWAALWTTPGHRSSSPPRPPAQRPSERRRSSGPKRPPHSASRPSEAGIKAGLRFFCRGPRLFFFPTSSQPT
jgi:hypothetical protein